MAIGRPRTIGDAPACGTQHSGGRRRSDPRLRGHAFLSREEWAEGPGEESRPDAVAAQAIEAKPVFGQIEPNRVQALACA